MYKNKQESGIFIQYSRMNNSKYCCHPPFHPPIFCRHSLKLLSPALPKLMIWILLSPPPLSSDPNTPQKFGTCTNSLPKTSPVPKQKKLPNPILANSTLDENEDELIPCPYDSRISYERIWGSNIPLMDYHIFELHHPFSMLVAGPRGAGKSEFVQQLLSLKRFIMTDPPERIVWFYGRHQPDLFRSLAQELPCIEFYEGLPTNIEGMFDRSK